MSIREQKEQEIRELEGKIAMNEKSLGWLPKLVPIGLVLFVIGIFIWSNYVEVKHGLFGIPIVPMSGSVALSLFFCLGGFVCFITRLFCGSSDVLRANEELRKQIQKLRAMSDEDYSNLLTRRKVLGYTKAVGKIVGKGLFG